ncbi:hypothetical protein IPV08_16980 [Methylobacterium sp. SD274]|uniref:hypothetical protein n=1 Tax=Methylobacterium sp. SD274 TaxID=2782009 RepID=UPI001A96E209|nr:hypothetical protein [Methylobacterium sp. SD274]MBO1021656.1 hypothetical protein [Methylobacterium sp. SD274]
MTSQPFQFDQDRFEKCRTLADRGATPGERAAGRAAAARVAASAGMTLEEAVQLVDAAPRPSTGPAPSQAPPSASRAPYEAYAYAWRKPKAKPEPITVAEMIAQKAAELERRKKAAARQRREDLKMYAEQAKADAVIQEQQAVRDREWAEARAQHQRAETAE